MMKDTTINSFSSGLLAKAPVFNAENIHAKNHKNAIVMFSGGMDSTVSLWWALDNYENVEVLIVDYNQPHVIEIDKAFNIARMVDVKHQKLKVDFPTSFWGIENHLTRGQACLMTSLAALNISHDGADIVMGILSTDNYGDCDRDFLDHIASVLFHPNDWADIGIATPLRALKSKSDVIALGYQYGAPLSLSWTCRDPMNGEPCHNCMQCRQRDEAFEAFYLDYGISQAEYDKWSSIHASPYHPYFRKVSRDIHIVVEAFLQAGGFKHGKKCYVYTSPDGKQRVSTHISSMEPFSHAGSDSFMDLISVHGYMPNNYRWELCVCSDGTIAATDILPDVSTIEEALVKKAEF